ncbi:MAG: hypothetical protein AB7I19_03890 [Planctomycetota bacterium]
MDPIFATGVWTQTDDRGVFEVLVPRQHFGEVWTVIQVPSPDRSFTYFEDVLPLDPEPVIEILDPSDPDWEARGTLDFAVAPEYPLTLELHVAEVPHPADLDWQLRVIGSIDSAMGAVTLRSMVGPITKLRGAVLLDVVDRRGVGVALLRYSSIRHFRDSLAAGIHVPTKLQRYLASGEMGSPGTVRVQRVPGPQVMRGSSEELDVNPTGHIEFVSAIDDFVCEGRITSSGLRLRGRILDGRSVIEWSRGLPGNRAVRVELVDEASGQPLSRAAVVCRSTDHTSRSDFHEEVFHTDAAGAAVALLVAGFEYEIQASTREIAGRVWRSPVVRVDPEKVRALELRAASGTFVQIEFRGLSNRDGFSRVAEICVETAPGSWERRWIGPPHGPYGLFLAPGSHRMIYFCDGGGGESTIHVPHDSAPLTFALALQPFEQISAVIPKRWREQGVQLATSIPSLPVLGWPNFASGRVDGQGNVDLWLAPGCQRILELWRDGVRIGRCELDATGQIVDDQARSQIR